MRRPSVVAVVGVVGCLVFAAVARVPAAAHVQAQPETAVLAELPGYMAILDLYRTGDGEPAVARLLNGGDPLLREASAARRGATNELLALARVAAMLHTDATAAAWREHRGVARRHFDVALEWARAAGELGDDRFERRWVLAAGLLLVELGSRDGGITAALDHFAKACARFDDDVPLLLAAAWLEERTALEPLVLDAPLVEKRQSARATQDKWRYLERAQGRLERARRLAPADAEPALRLAHVALRRDAPRDARRHLEPLLKPAAPPIAPADTYLAYVFLGQALLALDDDGAAAAAAFDAAIALMPRAQTARLARAAMPPSRVLPAPAGVLLESLGDEPGETRADPWIDYLVGRLTHGAPLRAALRDEVQR